ncbi:hypothetical protein E2C01_046972 [Portunus trituberculatus]|uniref:Uncharacterized protein n=1 Tax=Portunus trituberculatus TaxID=210409 RepID=A0A5B7G7J9_PORTR|nr:hypothetical protein [Portunus trituberculatus]
MVVVGDGRCGREEGKREASASSRVRVAAGGVWEGRGRGGGIKNNRHHHLPSAPSPCNHRTPPPAALDAALQGAQEHCYRALLTITRVVEAGRKEGAFSTRVFAAGDSGSVGGGRGLLWKEGVTRGPKDGLLGGPGVGVSGVDETWQVQGRGFTGGERVKGTEVARQGHGGEEEGVAGKVSALPSFPPLSWRLPSFLSSSPPLASSSFCSSPASLPSHSLTTAISSPCSAVSLSFHAAFLSPSLLRNTSPVSSHYPNSYSEVSPAFAPWSVPRCRLPSHALSFCTQSVLHCSSLVFLCFSRRGRNVAGVAATG